MVIVSFTHYTTLTRIETYARWVISPSIQFSPIRTRNTNAHMSEVRPSFSSPLHSHYFLELAISPNRPRSCVVSYACNTLACDSSV
jgi:hypothetical protein